MSRIAMTCPIFFKHPKGFWETFEHPGISYMVFQLLFYVCPCPSPNSPRISLDEFEYPDLSGLLTTCKIHLRTKDGETL